MGTKKAAQVTIERGQDIKFTKGQFRETVRLPSGPEREPSKPREIEKWRERRGEVFTLNDWDRPGREQEKGQTEML